MLLLQMKVMPLNTKDLIFVLAKYFCPIHFLCLVYFVVMNKFYSVLFKYSGKYMFSELPQTRDRNFESASTIQLCKYLCPGTV